MKIALAQIRPFTADIKQNIAQHELIILEAISQRANAIFFPELSISGYEPTMAGQLKVEINDTQLDIFQNLSNEGNITIGIGAPTKFEDQVRISMIIFQPNVSRSSYAKQILHKDELPYFVQGTEQLYLDICNTSVAPAICYESLHESHLETALEHGVQIYLASVAKPQSNMDIAIPYFSQKAKHHNIPILLCNSIGECDNFECAGHTAVWDSQGVLLGKIPKGQEGILMYDFEKKSVSKTYF